MCWKSKYHMPQSHLYLNEKKKQGAKSSGTLLDHMKKTCVTANKKSRQILPPLLGLVELEHGTRRILLGLLERLSRGLETVADVTEPLHSLRPVRRAAGKARAGQAIWKKQHWGCLQQSGRCKYQSTSENLSSLPALYPDVPPLVTNIFICLC